MKNFFVGMITVVVLTFIFVQTVSAWTSVFNYYGKEYEFSKNLTGTSIYHSTFGLSKIVAGEIRVNMLLYKQSGSSWNVMGSGTTCVFPQPVGIINAGCKPVKSSSGTNKYKGNWKQSSNNTAEMSASLDITKDVPF